jgi:hypothetical protein
MDTDVNDRAFRARRMAVLSGRGRPKPRQHLSFYAA